MMKRLAGMACLLGLILSVGGTAKAAAPISTGTWKISGNVQGVAVIVTCTMVEADLKVTGTCVDDQNKSHPMTGLVKDQMVSWNYASEYEGTPIVITWTGTVDSTGMKMSGTIAVDPFGVDGDFTATMGPAAPPATTPAP